MRLMRKGHTLSRACEIAGTTTPIFYRTINLSYEGRISDHYYAEYLALTGRHCDLCNHLEIRAKMHFHSELLEDDTTHEFRFCSATCKAKWIEQDKEDTSNATHLPN
jgi:hypothetical protein